MTAALYDKARKAFCDADIDLLVDSIKAVLIDTGAYTVNLATDQFLSDIPGGARIATSSALTGKDTTAGVFDADDAIFTAVSGASVEAYAYFVDTGVAGTSRLIAYLDTATGLPFTPSGADVTIVHDNGANRVFKL
jgi:hypothetical protein